MVKNESIGLMIVLSFFAVSCHRNSDSGKEQVAGIVQERIGKEVQWDERDLYIQSLTCQPLTPECAVQIALLNNPQIQATFGDLGIAHADLVEAGLFSNPLFEVDVRYPHKKKLKTNIEYLVATTFLDIFLIPLRVKLASTEFEQAKLRAANEILDLAFEVRQTYYELLSEQEMFAYTQGIAELASIQREILTKQQAVGNVNRLDFQQVQVRFLEAQLEITKSKANIIRLKEKLNRLLGLSEENCLILPEQLSKEIDDCALDLCSLESIALQERLDLQIARFEVVRFKRMLGIKEGWTYTQLKAGIAGEREPDGQHLIGYGISGEIPIFNGGQAARMRIFAQLRQAQERLAVLEIRVLSEVREGHHLLMHHLEIMKNYQVTILPLQNQILHSSEALYHVMGLGIDRLLENKRQELIAYRNFLESLKDYQVARVQLDRALGGYLFRLLPQKECGE